ncbi:MAG: DUF503 domain-containing protein [Sedimentisphaerales bacterium]|nr:DUF503 domain-containing protein [Sedimentisphaerales bacterium]
MVVGTLIVHIHLHGLGSLKDKRRIVKSLIGRLQSRFNFSISEVNALDNKAVGIIGLATASNDGVFVEKQLDIVIQFIQGDGRFYVGRIDREIFFCGED